ncbi:hypothetical protein BDA96_06G120800 [Sorghum bicolor]|uniref:Myb/SANT-like domain-containing protein n=2 Tax=Sorghum bicolor TaxID=4558 RepID=A0A921UBP9_SORBI|nr:L10-interacting MYB domain-containing protein [Sorghum bicolor]XP_021318612.1 L10-interacting MYB domain-containing protein [Sorghum bicolor]XP_021318613.1 L10-interacting MYB domain-containing protein [Sorghum bicolor]EES10957.1 hypothetical protein SORBI_3006G109200 [Sorghum bicolor]KAG0526152.1 hypothetical protein BDA96_06G120800 [Sorghum bicolor]|eukprot:XP_002446629.1 L10-interacting MYB domain-containing protein [Sorghum bicolor]
MANRARWMMKYEKGLVDILHENNNSHYRTPNGWRTDGWRKIVRDFTVRYPEAKFSKPQIQEHETQLKKDYKLIKSVLQRDGVSWDQSASMVRATDEIWDEIIEEMPKARKYQSKSFPLLDSLELLFDGPIPEGEQKSPSSIPQNVGGNDDGGNNISTVPGLSERPSGASWDKSAWNNISLLQQTALGPQGIDDIDMLQNRDEEVLELLQHGADRRPQRADEQAQSSSCVELQRDRRKKRKVPDVQQIMETYLNFRMKQARVKEQRAKDVDQFTISSCIKALHPMPDVSDEVKVLASDVFKDPENREIFLSYEPRLRTLWLKREVGKLLS